MLAEKYKPNATTANVSSGSRSTSDSTTSAPTKQR